MIQLFDKQTDLIILPGTKPLLVKKVIQLDITYRQIPLRMTNEIFVFICIFVSSSPAYLSAPSSQSSLDHESLNCESLGGEECSGRDGDGSSRGRGEDKSSGCSEGYSSDRVNCRGCTCGGQQAERGHSHENQAQNLHV